MKTITCNCLDGSNPLHFLATLGLFHIITLEDPDAKIIWHGQDLFVPAIITTLNCQQCHTAISHHLGIRGSVALNTRNHSAFETQQKAQITLNDLTTKTKVPNSQHRELKAIIGKSKRSAKRIKSAMGKDNKQAIKNIGRKHVVAELSDCIHQIPPESFRRISVGQLPPLWQTLLSGLGSDVPCSYKKGEISITRTGFSFSNGGSGKAILKDWLRNLSLVRKAIPDEADLLGFCCKPQKVTGLMWNPDELRDHALRWKDPTDEDTYSTPIFNSLAFVGLSFLTVMPGGHEGVTIGLSANRKRFVWPIWNVPLGSKALSSLLASRAIWEKDNAYLKALGIQTCLQANIILANKRNFFSPSYPT